MEVKMSSATYSHGHAASIYPGAVKSKSQSNGATQTQPVIRLRSVLIGICALAVCMVGPLVLVWTQSYINQVSLRIESKTEALAAVNSEITTLRLDCVRLSATARIERIARSRGLEYPVSGQIEVWEVRKPRSGDSGLFAYLMQTFFWSDKSGGPL
jgi:cell division protein FtsL